MIGTMTQDTKARIAELERQKIELNDQLETLGYSGKSSPNAQDRGGNLRDRGHDQEVVGLKRQ
jgi:hypothetical protein